MNNKKLYILTIAFVTMLLFMVDMVAVSCNQTKTAAVEKRMVEETKEEASNLEEIAEEDTLETEDKKQAEEAGSREEVIKKNAEEEKTPPTISLQIYSGPNFSSSEGICYYRIEAIITGNPKPDVNFSKDDSGGSWGSAICQVNLNDPSEIYELTAEAANSEGLATDSLILTWGCDEETENSKTMVFPDKQWQEASPESQGVDSARLEEAVTYLKAHSGSDSANELVIIRNGYMIYKGTDIYKVHGIWSMTKSFTSTALGLLIDDGRATLDTLAKDYVPSLADAYSGVTLRHFATMTSGYYAVGDEPYEGYVNGPSSTPFNPDPTPLFTPPGSRYAYWDSAMNQFANILTLIAYEPIAELFKGRIADPIKMDASKWDWNTIGKVDGIKINSGAGNHGKSIQISASEMARFGHLFLNRGKWKKLQLISSSWIDAATTVQVDQLMPIEPLSGGDGRGVYGFNWWVNGINAYGQRKWPGATPKTYAAMGYNNNVMFVIPEWNMVIVRLGQDQLEFNITDAIYGTFLEKVSQALK